MRVAPEPELCSMSSDIRPNQVDVKNYGDYWWERFMDDVGVRRALKGE